MDRKIDLLHQAGLLGGPSRRDPSQARVEGEDEEDDNDDDNEEDDDEEVEGSEEAGSDGSGDTEDVDASIVSSSRHVCYSDN